MGNDPKPKGARKRMISTQLAAFSGEGQSITGLLTEKGRQTIRGNDCGRYILKNPTGTIIVNGTVQIDEAMVNAEVGELIELVYLGTRPTGNGFDVKVFEVFVLEQGESPALDAAVIDHNEAVDFDKREGDADEE